jgi:hypothetical protein
MRQHRTRRRNARTRAGRPVASCLASVSCTRLGSDSRTGEGPGRGATRSSYQAMPCPQLQRDTHLRDQADAMHEHHHFGCNFNTLLLADSRCVWGKKSSSKTGSLRFEDGGMSVSFIMPLFIPVVSVGKNTSTSRRQSSRPTFLCSSHGDQCFSRAGRE